MRLLALALIAGLAACKVERTPTRQTRGGSGELARETIERARAHLATSLIKHDAHDFASLFSPDGVYARAHATDVTSPQEIQGQLSAFFRDTTVTWVVLNDDRLDFAADGRAYETGQYEETVVSRDSVERKTSGRYAISWVRGPEASYRIERLLLVPQSVSTDTLR